MERNELNEGDEVRFLTLNNEREIGTINHFSLHKGAWLAIVVNQYNQVIGSISLHRIFEKINT